MTKKINSKKNSYIIISIILIILCIITFLFFKNRFSNNEISNANKENQYTAEKSSTSQNTEKNNNQSSSNSSNTSSQNVQQSTQNTEKSPQNPEQPSENTYSNPPESTSPPLETQIASFSTKIYTKDNARQNNMQITASRLNGKIIKNGETFSFCKTLGPSSTKNGYQEADIFDNARK